MSTMSLLRIGDLARLGGVSVRMLRHYHEIGLLVPARVDGSSGYDSEQLGALRRIVQLKELGLSLAEVESIANGDGGVEGTRTLLLASRREAAEQATTARRRIERIDAFLAGLEGTETITPGVAPVLQVTVKSVAPRLVAQLTAVAESWAPTDIGPVIQPLYPELIARMAAAGVDITGPSTAWYEDTTEGRVAVNATLEIAGVPEASTATLGFAVIELPGLAKVASTIHRGTMDDCDTTYQALLEWVERNGYRPLGYSREIDIECGPDRRWITELQIPIESNESNESNREHSP
jgi:DNA-binding transcriptional MerR regulator/effector-binding domain-containing protein